MNSFCSVQLESFQRLRAFDDSRRDWAKSFGQLWSYEREELGARRFFENWRSSLKWQRLKPYEKFAAMIDRHWDGIAAYCRPENKGSSTRTAIGGALSVSALFELTRPRKG